MKIMKNKFSYFYYQPFGWQYLKNPQRLIKLPVREKQVLKWMRKRYHTHRVVYEGGPI